RWPRLVLGGGAPERLERVVALVLERRTQAGEPVFDPLGRGIADVVDAFAEHPLPLARETLDREVELAAQAARRVLLRDADREVELLRRRLRVARRLARDDALQL